MIGLDPRDPKVAGQGFGKGVQSSRCNRTIRDRLRSLRIPWSERSAVRHRKVLIPMRLDEHGCSQEVVLKAPFACAQCASSSVVPRKFPLTLGSSQASHRGSCPPLRGLPAREAPTAAWSGTEWFCMPFSGRGSHCERRTRPAHSSWLGVGVVTRRVAAREVTFAGGVSDPE